MGPLVTMFNVRQSTQRIRNLSEIEMLKRVWTTKLHPFEGARSAVRIDTPVFGFSRPAVLSWNLTGEERRGIHEFWIDEVRASGPAFQTLEATSQERLRPSIPRHPDDQVASSHELASRVFTYSTRKVSFMIKKVKRVAGDTLVDQSSDRA